VRPSEREIELLEFLVRSERLVISRERLLDEVWDYDSMAVTNTIDIFISNCGDRPMFAEAPGAGLAPGA
jgi:DNA-binding response OmpR family regulator